MKLMILGDKKKSLPLTVLVFAILLGCFIIPLRAAHMFDPNHIPRADGALNDSLHVEELEWNMFHLWAGSAMMMTEQLSMVMMHQAFAIGTFFDAKATIRTQRLYQQMSAEAHKDYQPSVQMCSITTNIRSLAQADFHSKINAKILNEIMMRRDTRKFGSSTAAGLGWEYEARIDLFKTVYCDVDENGDEIESLCGSSGGQTERVGKDIDFNRVLDGKYTLNVDFTDTTTTDEEEDIIALSKNLFSHEPFNPIPQELLNQKQAKNEYTDLRSINAIRSVARHSFTNLVGMKAQTKSTGAGTNNNVKPYMDAIIKGLGVDVSSGVDVQDQLDEFLGLNPSYFAQMEVLTSKLYQTPSFYVNLYDKPTNVKRTRVALKAFNLMQDRDRFEASLRREMLVSMLLEAKLRVHEEDVNNTHIRFFSR